MRKVKVAILDHETFDNPNITVPINMTSIDDCHAQKVYESFVRMGDCSHIDFYVMPNTKYAIKACKDLYNIDIICMSISDTFFGDVKGEQYASDRCLLITSAGNSGNDGETGAAQRPEWLAVGAINQSLDPRSYSSYGLGKVVTVGIDGYDGNKGTSFAAPYVAYIASLYYKKYYEVLEMYEIDLGDQFIPPKQVVNWIKFNSHDVWEEGFDLKTGYGLLKVPKHWEFKITTYAPESLNKEIIKIVDGEVISHKLHSIDDVYAPMQIVEGRSLINPRDVSEDVECGIYWDGKVRVVR